MAFQRSSLSVLYGLMKDSPVLWWSQLLRKR